MGKNRITDFWCEENIRWIAEWNNRSKYFYLENTRDELVGSWKGDEAKEILDAWKELSGTEDFIYWFYEEGYDSALEWGFSGWGSDY